MKKKQVLAVSSALMIGTTTALTGLPTPVMAQENTEVVQEAVVEENKTGKFLWNRKQKTQKYKRI